MATPKQVKSRNLRTPTPKLSDRKKSLFESEKRISPINEISNNNSVDGVNILGSSSPTEGNTLDRISTRSLRRFSQEFVSQLIKNDTQNTSTDLDELKSNRANRLSKPKRPSQTISSNNNVTEKLSNLVNENSKEEIISSNSANDEEMSKNKTSTDELGHLFSDTLNLKNLYQQNAETDEVCNCAPNGNSQFASPKRKLRKYKDHSYDENDNRNGCHKCHPPEIRIPAKSFYSQKSSSSAENIKDSKKIRIAYPIIKEISRLPNSKKFQKPINKGVTHKIRKHTKKTATLQPRSLERFLETIKHEKLKSLWKKYLPISQVEKVQEILKNSPNPIEMARPLNIYQNNIESSEESMSDDEESIDENALSPEILAKRKFFKTGRSTSKKECYITKTLKLNIRNGKIKLAPNKKKHVRKSNSFVNLDDSAIEEAQNEVDKIIGQLDTSESGIGDSLGIDSLQATTATISAQETEEEIIEKNYAEFRKRIPYNTNDPNVIEQQNLLLDFLIYYNICTEENFVIFIADPDNHKDEAGRIIDRFEVVPENDNYEINNTNIESEVNKEVTSINENQKLLEEDPPDGTLKNITSLEITCSENIHENNNKELSDKNMEIDDLAASTLVETKTPPAVKDTNKSPQNKRFFPIFDTVNFRPIIIESKRKLHKRRNLGIGANQLQIDAGQKEFGAKRCAQCGLTYTAHEAEEENLHEEYHRSFYIFKFQGWINEDIVEFVTEWGIRGRIICLTELSYGKHRQRLLDIIRLIDKEIGFNTNIIPLKYKAYLAVANNQIISVCLAHPLKKANRYLIVNEVECCTEDSFNVKCGISRIWTTPFKRRSGIAKKLIETLKLHFISTKELTMEDIAFSPPTEQGILLAQHLSNRKDFLIYDNV